MLIYASFDGFDFIHDSYKSPENFFLRTSLANMGFSTPKCSQTPIDWSEQYDTILSFECQGATKISRVLSSGISDYSYN